MLQLIAPTTAFDQIPKDTLVSKKPTKGRRTTLTLLVWSMEGDIIKELDVTGEYPEILNTKVILHIKSGLTYQIPTKK